MAVEARPELVGKRFLCVSGEEPLELGEIGRWGWRAGVIRAVSHRDNDNAELTVYVEFDDLEWEKREWVKVYEDFRIFLVEHQLVWAKKRDGAHTPSGGKPKHVQWPALTFKPLVGKTVLGSITAVEFFSDRRLDFLSDDGAYQLYQDEADSLNPVLRDNQQLHEEVKAWLKDQKVQEIFMQGPYSLNGYRVRVYRQDSATQWFTGIITHHDLFSRTMVVMNDQVLEPQNVDPCMVQMTFLDDVVHSLLKGENIGITCRRRSRSSQNSSIAHTSGGRPNTSVGGSQGHYTRAQANSPRPVMNSSSTTPKQAGQSQQPQQLSQQAQQQPSHQHQQQQAQSSPGQQRGSRSSRRKGSDSSVPDDDGSSRIKEEKPDVTVRGDFPSKSKSKQTAANRRRKVEEDEKKSGALKRLKTEASDASESSDSENSHKRGRASADSSSSSASSSSEPSSENELRGKALKEEVLREPEQPLVQPPPQRSTRTPQEGDCCEPREREREREQAAIGRLSPWEDLRPEEKSSKAAAVAVETLQLAESDRDRREERRSPRSPLRPPHTVAPPPPVTEIQGSSCIVDMRSTVRSPAKDQYSLSGPSPQRTHTPKQTTSCVIDITEDASTHPSSQESSDAVSALLASQKADRYTPEPRHLVLTPTPSDLRKGEVEQTQQRLQQQQQHQQQQHHPQPHHHHQHHLLHQQHLMRNQGAKLEFGHLEVIRPLTSVSESAAALAEREKVAAQQYAAIVPSCIKSAAVAEESRRQQRPSPSPDTAKPLRPHPNPSPELLKPLRPYPNLSPDMHKSKPHAMLETSKPRPNTSPEVSKHKAQRHMDITVPNSISPSSTSSTSSSSSFSARGVCKSEPSPSASPAPRSSFKPVPARSSELTKSSLIIDKNEHFTVYRDPALVRPESEPSSASATSNHVAYLHSHLHPLHSSTHATCLTPGSHHTSHLLPPPTSMNPHGGTAPPPPPHHSVHPHPHLIPGVLPGMHPPPPSSLLAGHPRVDSGGLGHLALAAGVAAAAAAQHHPHQAQQQQFLQQQASAAAAAAAGLLPPPHPHPPQGPSGAPYNQLGLYPIIWPYPNGNPHSYPPGLGLPSSKWGVHPGDNPVSSDSSLRRNTPSPWLHQHTPVSSADSLALLSHVPGRPASADPHRPIKISAHASPPLSKSNASEHHKEDLEKKVFAESIRSLATAAHLKQESDRSRTPTGKELHRGGYLDPLNKNPRLISMPDASERVSKYKEENRRILQESIEVAPFTAKLRPGEVDREQYPRVPPPLPASAVAQPQAHKPHGPPMAIDRDRDPEQRPASASDIYKFKPATQQSNYFTTLSNSVVNEPPRLYPSKELNSYFEKVAGHHSASSSPLTLGFAGAGGGGTGGGGGGGSKSLSKPPPLIKHQPEGEGLVGKITEQLSQQQTAALLPLNVPLEPRRNPTVSPSGQLRMPALHRAPVFHPPTQQTLDRKEAASYGRLSPPTLTPIQPVNVAGKLTEQQKPPTLVPELREVKSGVDVGVTEPWRVGVGDAHGHDRGVWLGDKSRTKPQAATASVIVRQSTCIKYDGGSSAVKASARDYETGKGFMGKPQAEVLKHVDARDTGRVILLNPKQVNLEEVCMPYDKNFIRTAQAASISSPMVAVGNSVCNIRTDVTTSLPSSNFSVLNRVSELSFPTSTLANANSSTRTDGCLPKQRPVCGADNQETAAGGGPRTTSPSMFPSSGTTSPAQASPMQAFPGNFIHPKKHKAALAAAQSRGSGTPENERPAPTPPIPSQDASNVTPAAVAQPVTTNTAAQAGKGAPLPNGQSTPPLSQPNYHKLKKAWLTRHSEEDRNTNRPSDKPSSGGSSAPASTPSASNAQTSEIIKPCTVNLAASTSGENDSGKESKPGSEDGAVSGGSNSKLSPEDRRTRRGSKRAYESASESGEESDGSDGGKLEQRAKRQPKPTYKKKQNDMQRRKEDDDNKPNGIFRSAREKTKLKLASSNGIPRSVLKDWRKVRKLKQTGESFLQDDSCSEIGPNLQKCRECRVVRSKKGEEPAHSPVFCRFYYFRRLTYSKNGVIRIDGFSTPDQFDDEALSLWAPDMYEENELDLDTSKYILNYIGDKFCQLVMTENTAASWVKKDVKIAWKRAVRGVREMCDACEATLFNMHWVCQKCGFVVCLDCYKAKERKSSKDKELYTWLKCVKGQPHDHKHLMPTQIIPGTVLTDLVCAMHSLREKYGIRAHCACAPSKQAALLGKLPTTNGVSQVLQNVLNHSNKISLCKAEAPPTNASPKLETNGGAGSPASDTSSDSKLTPPESQSPLHFLADLAEQKSREEKKENKECVGKALKEEPGAVEAVETLHCKTTSLVSAAAASEQGSTLRDLLTTTAGKLRLGSTDAGIAFAPVFSPPSQTGKSVRSMPNILDDIIASVVETKIPASRGARLGLKQEPLVAVANDEPRGPERKQRPPVVEESAAVAVAVASPPKLHADIPHSWLYGQKLLWLKDHRNSSNWKLFRECWKQGQPVLVSGVHKKLNASLWKADSFNQEFADHQGDLLNCKDSVVISNSGIKEFWDGFEDLTKRPKSKDGEPMVYRLKDWPSGEEFMALMPSRYDDLMKNLPLPEYSDPEGNLNLASHLPSFFVRPDLGPRLCCAYGVAASQEQDFGTANLHVEVSDIVSVLVYVGVAKGNGVLSKTGVLKRLEEEDLDEQVKRRLKDSSETPGALWHIYVSKDVDKIKEFLHKLAKEQGLDLQPEQDPMREQGWYLTRKLRQRLLEEHGVQGWTVLQFLGDSVLIPAGAMHQVQNLHSCVQVINDFVSPEHVAHSFRLTQELRSSKEEVNYEDKLQVKNIFYHCVKNAVGTLKRCCAEEQGEEEENS